MEGGHRPRSPESMLSDVPVSWRQRKKTRKSGEIAQKASLAVLTILGSLTTVTALPSQSDYAALCPNLTGISFQALGPFPSSGDHTGGGDALEAFGGIGKVPFNDSTLYTSELVVGGKVGWRTVTPGPDGVVQDDYPNMDVYGLMTAVGTGISVFFYTWAVGQFEVEVAATYQVQCLGVDGFEIDGQAFQGDPKALANWWGTGGWLKFPVKLEAGWHTLRLKYQWQFGCQIICPEGGVPPVYPLTAEQPSVFNPGLVNRLPDVVDGELASPFVAFPVVNAMKVPATVDVSLGEVIQRGEKGNEVKPMGTAKLLEPIRLLPGQGTPLPIRLNLPSLPICQSSVNVTVNVIADFADDTKYSFPHTLELSCKKFGSAYAFTFLDVDGSVQYGTAKPPKGHCPEKGCPIVLALHGADVDSGSFVWMDAIPSQDRAWVLFPTNRDKYGYDWQGLGAWDTLNCLEYFADNLPGVPATLYGSYPADKYTILFTGHSMGGHGCLIFSTHFPDLAVGAVCAAAWIRYDQYIDEYPGVQSSFMDPILTAVLESAVADSHTDVAAVNLKGVPFMARMGSADDNVCPWNLRRFARILDEINGKPDFAIVSEVPGKPHWWGEVLSAPEVQEFYQKVLNGTKPSVPRNFRVRTMNLWHNGRGGIRILQFQTPFTSSWIDVTIAGGDWKLVTNNVRRFEFVKVPGLSIPAMHSLSVDGQNMTDMISLGGHFCQNDYRGLWVSCSGERWQNSERGPSTSGPMRQIFHGHLSIVYGTQDSPEHLVMEAVQLANRLLAHAHGQVTIYSDAEVMADPSVISERNLILIGGPAFNVLARELVPMSTVLLSTSFDEDSGAFEVCGRTYDGPSVGVSLLGAFNSTRGEPRLMVIASGTDVRGLSFAVGLIPVGANREIPDYVIAGPEYSWQSAGGFLAAGYFGNDWLCRPDISYPRRFQEPGKVLEFPREQRDFEPIFIS